MNRHEQYRLSDVEERLRLHIAEETEEKVAALAEYLGVRLSRVPPHYAGVKYEVYPIDNGKERKAK